MSGTVSWAEGEGRNMYGCLPCPKCGSEFRAAYKSGRSAGMVACDDCGFSEPATWPESDPSEPLLPCSRCGSYCDDCGGSHQ
jgi:predicted RNA-binding Zn-ribbon protein involved in translation (DUF1610 family)